MNTKKSLLSDIKQHSINIEMVKEDFESKKHFVDLSFNSVTKTNNLGSLYKNAKEFFECCTVIDLDSNYYLNIAIQAIECNFLFAAKRINFYEFNVSDEKKVIIKLNDRFNARYKTNLPTYIEAIYLSIIARNNSVIKNLIQIQNSDLPQQSNLVDAFFGDYADFLRSVLSENGKAGELLIKTYKGLYPDNIQHAIYKYLENNNIPHIELWIKLLGGDEDEFNEFLVKALERHKSYWSSNKGMNKGDGTRLRDYSKGFISIPLTAICILAKKSGINIKTKSNYIPETLITLFFLGKKM